MRVLVTRLQAGSVTREDWSNLAALSLVYSGDEVCLAIAEQGLDAFILTCQPIYEGHAFNHDDYKRIYARICEAANRYQRDLVRH